ncbi:hypothetical protein MKW94_004054 [Papaver nudicaule]|uniref:60S acidic ribosomal protein P1 n=1 Tax=Papaver nudicaule TaxID=74823 RepID=A0AA41V6S4_PAPNU|nr:hypothetical protein [Papaver nudicaule]
MSGEIACTYATLILHDDGIPVTAEKIATLIKAANVQCESYWPNLFSKLAEKRNIEDLITNIGAGGGAASVAVSAPAGGAAAAEDKDESDEDIGGLFDMFD